MTAELDSTMPVVERPTRRVSVLAISALALGGFAIGTTEFVSMGLLPQIADGVGVAIPAAGHLIAAYALGVVVGAPVLAYLGARLPRKRLALVLAAALAIGNLASALALSYEALFAARFLAGLPHGAYFGVASLLAAGMVDPARRGRAVAMVLLGLSIANLVGVPGGTWLGQRTDWRIVYVLIAALAIATAIAIALLVPRAPHEARSVPRRELGAFKRPQVWLALAAGSIGFGGMFALYTYIAETVTRVGGLPQSTVPVFLLVFGLGMCAGMVVGGDVLDRFGDRALLASSVAIIGALLLFWATAATGWGSLPALFAVAVLSQVIALGLQLRLMAAAHGAPTLGAALNHSSLNIANAVGAWLGGLVIAGGWGYRAPTLVGAALAVAGVLVLLVAFRAQRSGRLPL